MTARATTMFRWGAAACLAGAIAWPLYAQAAQSDKHKLQAIHSETIDDQEGKSEAIAVRIEDGKISVTRNGKEVPLSQIKQEGGRIIILDEDGNEIKGISIGATGDGDAFWVGEGGEWPMAQAFALAGGDAPKVMIGVHMGDAGPALEKHLGLTPGKTTMITDIIKGLAAEKAGLQQFDIIIAIGDSDAADADAIKGILAGKEPGDKVRLKVIQAGKPKTFDLELEAYDEEAMGHAGMFGGEFMPHFGELNLNDLPNMKGFDNVFVVPEGGQHWELVAPRVHEHLLKQFEGLHGQQGGGDANLEEKLNRLDQRMADLEVLLQKLIEQRGGGR